jgi:FkbM family methyltransferase
MLKTLIAAAAERLGYTIIPNWQLGSYSAAENLRKLFALLSIGLVIDVGANAGQFRDLLRTQVGYRGRIASFEPNLELARSLQARAKADPSWEVMGTALGSAAGEAEFNIMADNQFSSFLAPRHDEVARFKDMNVVREQARVQIVTLDSVMPELTERHASRGVFLKLDTQGYDLEVLKGASASLPRIAALQTEAALRPIYAGAPSDRAVIDYAAAHGFVVSGFFPSNAGHFPELIDYDCQMVRRDATA